MSFYEVVLFVHVVAAILWIGGGFAMVLIGARADRTDDAQTLATIFTAVGWLANRLFIPASLVVLAAGIVMTIDAWAFGDLWIVLALVGYAIAFATGVFVLTPRAERLGAQLERDGGVRPDSLLEMRKVLTLARLDYGVLFAIVALMVLKPTGDDAGVLALIAAAVVAWWAYVLTKVRALEGSPAAATTP